MYTRLEVDFMWVPQTGGADSRGPWPRDVYVNMIRAQGQMLAYSSIMANVFMQLSPEWCTLLTDYSSIFNPRFVSDSSAGSLLTPDGGCVRTLFTGPQLAPHRRPDAARSAHL